MKRNPSMVAAVDNNLFNLNRLFENENIKFRLIEREETPSWNIEVEFLDDLGQTQEMNIFSYHTTIDSVHWYVRGIMDGAKLMMQKNRQSKCPALAEYVKKHGGRPWSQ